MPADGASVLAFRLVVHRPGPRVVLDTNLFVAAYWNPRSASARILAACEEERLTAVSSPAIRREMQRILRNARTSADFQARAWSLLDDGEVVHPSRSIRIVADDPDDDKFVECAVEAQAPYIISSDDHLLRLGTYEGVEVVKPGEFARRHLLSAL